MKNKGVSNSNTMFEIRHQFYELMVSKSHLNFNHFVSELARTIKEATNASSCAIYLINEYTDSIQLYGKNTPSEGCDVELEPNNIGEWFSQMADQKPLGYGQVLYPKKADTLIYRLPLQIENKNYGFLLLTFLQEEMIYKQLEAFQDISSETVRVLIKMRGVLGILNEEKKYELLYRVTSKFHSSIRMDDVLKEIIFTLQQIYPEFEYHLLLSQDDSIHERLPVKIISYEMEDSNHASTQAYLTGEVQIEDRIEDKRSCLYAPLKGKQGIYGVLQIITPKSVLFPEKDIEFISLLANTAGNALENARLYQQSKKLVEDLQLINSTSQRLNMNLSLSDTISYISKQTVESFHAEEVGVILYSNDDLNYFELQKGSTSFFYSTEGKRFIEFLNRQLEQQKEGIFIGDFLAKFPSYPFDFQSVMAIPMIQEKRMVGLVIVLHHQSYYFSFETFKLLQSIVQHSALTVINSMLKEELEQLVKTDYLTKLFSRKYLDESLHRHMESGDQGAFLMMDIDDFKKVNDRYGHHVGDQIIIQVAEIIKEHIAYKDVAARWGGEELAVYFPDTTLEEASRISERIVHTVSEKTEPGVTISCGVSFWDDKTKDQVKDVFIRADRALYKAKESGKNCVKTQNDLGS
ncbi:MAG: diguanylate cyclase [Bacillaceae bacterium]|nr:diguanylate cyclase [Bacillaceae bacterium]